MKNLILLTTLLCACTIVRAQQLPDYSIPQEASKEAKLARANEIALQCARYIMATPADSTNEDLRTATMMLVTWMTGTKEYKFNIGHAIINFIGSDQNLMPVTMAAMTEYEMTHPADKDNQQKVLLATTQQLIAYATNPANGIRPTGELEKAIAADKKGQLQQYLADKE